MEVSLFISIIGLLCNFVNEFRFHNNKKDINFKDWLQRNNHNEILQYIEENHKLLLSINSLLSENIDILNNNFEYLDKSLSQIASQIGFFQEIAESIHPNENISDQAISILSQFIDSDAKFFFEINELRSGIKYQTDNGILIEFSEDKFIEEDLDTLSRLGLLREDFSTSYRKFCITRNTEKYIDMVKKRKF